MYKKGSTLDFFKVLADDSRLKILEFVKTKKSAGCCEIARHIKKDASTTFRHIEQLEKANLLKTKKQGKTLLCSLKNTERIDRLLKLANEIQR